MKEGCWTEAFNSLFYYGAGTFAIEASSKQQHCMTGFVSMQRVLWLEPI